MNDSPGARPPQLDDPAWMARNAREHGQMWIALELGVTRKVVRTALAKLGIESGPVGRRRGSPAPSPAARRRRPALERISERLAAEQVENGPPPTLRTVGARFLAAVEADRAGDKLALDDALEALASACALTLDHLQLVRSL